MPRLPLAYYTCYFLTAPAQQLCRCGISIYLLPLTIFSIGSSHPGFIARFDAFVCSLYFDVSEPISSSFSVLNPDVFLGPPTLSRQTLSCNMPHFATTRIPRPSTTSPRHLTGRFLPKALLLQTHFNP
jgi:hypothetical protein